MGYNLTYNPLTKPTPQSCLALLLMPETASPYSSQNIKLVVETGNGVRIRTTNRVRYLVVESQSACTRTTTPSKAIGMHHVLGLAFGMHTHQV